jgi:hypothetical protein
MKILKFNESFNDIGYRDKDRESVGLKEYIIVENFTNFRHKGITILLFRVRKVDPDGIVYDKDVQIEQLRYYKDGKLEQMFGKYNYNTERMSYIKPHIIYQTNDKKDAEEMLDILEISKKYNL